MSTTGGTAGPSLFFAMNLHVVLLNLVKAIAVIATLGAVCAQAQPSSPANVWRCGQLFTNQPQPGQACELLTSVSPTVVDGTRVQSATAPSPSRLPTVQQSLPQSMGSSQQARSLLQAELREQEARWRQLQQDWNLGHPLATSQQPLGSVAYQERVTSLREQLQRTEADLAALRRELARIP